MMITKGYNEKVVVQKLILGNEQAFKELYDHYKNILYSFCYRITKSEEWSEEIVHDVFLKIWLEKEKINVDLPFGGYLYRITRNASINFIKKLSVDTKLKNQFLIQAERMHNDTEESLDLSQCESYLELAIEKLPPQQQTVFKMSRIDGMTHSEIASALNLSKGTVKNYMMIALSTLKKHLVDYSDKIIVIGFAWLIG